MHKTNFAFLIILVLSVLIFPGFFADARSSANFISINSDGTVQPSNSPLARTEDVYTLTANFSGSIFVHRSNIVIDGAGYALNGDGTLRSVGIDLKNNTTSVPSPEEIWNVTIKNLAIINFDFSVDTNGGGNDTFLGDYIANTLPGLQGGIFFWACRGNNVSYCTISGEPAVYMHFGSSLNTITHNNLAGGIDLRIGGTETVDSNYFADYKAKYRNASEVGSTGVWNTPYVYEASAFAGPVKDNHPLTHPLQIAGFPSGMPPLVELKVFATPPLQSGKQEPDQLYVLALLVVLPVAVAAAAAILFWKRRKAS